MLFGKSRQIGEQPDPLALARYYASRADGTFADGLIRIADEIKALREVIRQANDLGVIYDDLGSVVILHDDIDTTEVVHPEAVRRAIDGGRKG